MNRDNETVLLNTHEPNYSKPVLDPTRLDPERKGYFPYLSAEKQAREMRLYQTNTHFCEAVNGGAPFMLVLRQGLNPAYPDLVSVGAYDYHEYIDEGMSELPGNLYFAMIFTESGQRIPFGLFQEALSLNLYNASEFYFPGQIVPFHRKIKRDKTTRALRECYERQREEVTLTEQQFIAEHGDLLHTEELHDWLKEFWNGQFKGIFLQLNGPGSPLTLLR